MKKLLFMMTMCLSVSSAIAQSCPDCGKKDAMTTKPDDPKNCERSDMINNLDWKQRYFNYRIRNTINPALYNDLESPYWNFSSDLYYDDLVKQANSDFKPEDGWELIKFDFGKLLNGDNHGGVDYMPYMLFYNKYSGVLRLFASLSNFAAPNILRATLRNYHKTGFDPSGVIASYDTAQMRPLDRETPLKMKAAIMLEPVNNSAYFQMAEFTTSFDPCTCNYKSALEFDFEYITESTIQLNGWMHIPGQESNAAKKDYILSGFVSLTQVVVGGAMVATGNPAGIFLITSGAPGLLSSTAGIIDQEKPSSNPANKEWYQVSESLKYLSFVTKTGGDVYNIYNKPSDSVAKYIELFGVASNAFDHFSSSGDGKSGTAFFSKGNIQLSGTVTTATPQAGDNVLIANPGSLNSKNAPEHGSDPNSYGYPAYPLYNQALGVFGLLETPELRYFEQRDLVPPGSLIPYYLYHRSYWLGSTPTLIFNPALPINWNRSVVEGAIEIEESYSGSYTPPTIISLDNTIRLDYTKTGAPPTQAGAKVISGFFDLNQLQRVYSGYIAKYSPTSIPTVKPYLRIKLFLVYDNVGSDGNPTVQQFVVRFPMKIIPSATNPLTQHDDYIKLVPDPGYIREIPDTTFTQDAELIEKNIRITGKITVSPGKKVIIRGLRYVDMVPGAELDPNIEIRIGFDDLNKFTPVSFSNTQAVGGFCSGSADKYKARYWYERNENPEGGQPGETIEDQTNLFPNPASDQVTLSIDLAESSSVSAYVSDISGARLMDIESGKFLDKGKTQINFSTAELAAGLYLVTIESSGGKKTLRLIIER